VSAIRFRPHHFLCSLGFEGKGYSDAFTANMAAIVLGRLRAAAGETAEIEVVGQTDDICAPCPKRVCTDCLSQPLIAALDAAHAEALALTPGDRLTWGAALDRIRRRVAPEDLDRICAGCQWLDLGLCRAAVARLAATTTEV